MHVEDQQEPEDTSEVNFMFISPPKEGFLLRTYVE